MSLAFCRANVFVAVKVSKDLASVKRILKRFGVTKVSLEGTPLASFDIEGHSLDAIKDELIIPITVFLDPYRRSSFFYRSSEGKISTIMVQDGQLNCA